MHEQQPFSESDNNQFRVPYSNGENAAETPQGPIDEAYQGLQQERQDAIPEMSPEVAVQWVSWAASDIVHSAREPELAGTINLSD